MTPVRLLLELPAELDLRRVTGSERVGVASAFEIEASGPADAPLAPSDVLRKSARLTFDSALGARAVAGVVTRFVLLASDHAHERIYRLTLQSRFALMGLRRPSRAFQHLSVPEIVATVVKAAGYQTIDQRLTGSYPQRRWVVQYRESDAAFVRRLCEDAGLYFRFEATDDDEAFVLEDASRDGPRPYHQPLAAVSRSAQSERLPIAIEVQGRHRVAPTKSTTRDYDPDHPSVQLEGVWDAGARSQQELEVYDAPGGFTAPEAGPQRARLLLEALRANAAELSFRSNALALSPGCVFELEPSHEFSGHVAAAGAHWIVGVTTRWRHGEELHVDVDAIPAEVPFRLPRVTPRPRIVGVQSAWVTGQAGHEIHPDALARVHLRFHWDVHGPGDHTSSLPVRVVQPNAPGALIVPRVGWEVFVAFEDGDPDRPYVLGRSYNQKQPPPLSLPANKTVTSIATDSSPGAGARTVVQFDDAAGREHLLFNAPFAKVKSVTGNQTKQTAKNENLDIGANASTSIGGDEAIKVKLGFLGGYGSRRVTTGGVQYQSSGGHFVSAVGAESVFVAGAVAEQVGDPVKGAANVAFNQVLAHIGAAGGALSLAAAAAGVAKAAADGYARGGEAGAKQAAGGAALGVVMSFVPGGEAILATVTGASRPMPWDHGVPPESADAVGGGGAGAGGGDGGPAGPGPGHRGTVVASSHTEIVGGAYGVATPGAISWVTLGPSTLIVGSHSTNARSAGVRVGGLAVEQVGSLLIDSKTMIARKVLGTTRTSVAGALQVTAGGDVTLAAKSKLTLKVDGTLQIGGSVVTFKCGGSKISASSAGVKIESSSIKITGSSKQSGSYTHK